MKSRLIHHILMLIMLTLAMASLSARTWTNSEGKNLDGKLVKISLATKSVDLKKDSDGEVLTVPLAKLSQEDQAYVMDIVNRKKNPPEPGFFENLKKEKPLQIVILIILNIPIYFLFGMVFFNGWGDFFECIRFWLTPNIVSFFRGEYGEDRMAEFKLALFMIACGAMVFAEFFVLNKYIL